MRTLFLTSCLDLYQKDEEGNRFAHHFGNKNEILDNLKKYIKKYDNMLIVASDEFNTDATDMYARVTIESFELTLPFGYYTVLDCRNKTNAEDLIKKADFILIMGGHVPTQNNFFANIKLKELLKYYDGVVLGISAGSMNSASIVYCPPELEGEGYDKNFKRFLPGLELTEINVFPHYNKLIDEVLDGRKVMDYTIEDSNKITVLVLEDGSYCLQRDNNIKLYGKAYKLKNEKLEVICQDDECVTIDNNLNRC